jgi:hypothetical protein
MFGQAPEPVAADAGSCCPDNEANAQQAGTKKIAILNKQTRSPARWTLKRERWSRWAKQAEKLDIPAVINCNGHREMFGYLGVFSAGVPPAVEKPLEEQLKKQLDDEALKKGLRLFYVAVGSNDDQATVNARNLLPFFGRHHVKYIFQPSEGGHILIPR